jgi:glycosyltransferase involved in cell wall biosynthesis
MKILFLQFPLEPAWGGAEEQTLLLARGLKNAGHQVRIFSSSRSLVSGCQKAGLASQYLWLGWEPTSVKALVLFPMTFLVAFFKFLVILAAGRYQAVFCLSLTDKLIASPLANLFGAKVFWMEHTRLGRWFYKNPLLPFYRLFARSAQVIAPSYFSRNQLVAAGVPIDRVRIIYPGIEMPGPIQILKVGNFTVGFLGRLTKEKGVETLLRAMTKLPDDIKLKIAGTGPEETRLKKLTLELNLSGRVEFLGLVSDKKSFFEQISVLVVPSTLPESFGLVAAEGMAASRPVIASRIGALPEIIENEKTGLLFAPGEENDLVKKILFLKESPKREVEFAVRARMVVEKRFRSGRMTSDILTLLKTP